MCFKSSSLVLETGIPQGRVLSPIIISAYTNSIVCSRDWMSLFKYVDAIAVVAHLTDAEEVHTLVQPFTENSLELNALKTKEDHNNTLYNKSSQQNNRNTSPSI